MKVSTLRVLASMVIAALVLLMIICLDESCSAKHMYGKSRSCKVTAYCGCSKCCGKSDGITATGTKASEGRTVAVDPRYIPYGSTVLIYHKKELVGIYIAEDCGGAIKGNKLDIFFEKHNDALEWGIKKCKVYIIDAKG